MLAVVDNNPNADAQGVVDAHDGPLIYSHEPIPGIAASRNRSLSLADNGDYDYVVFIDDDEWVAANWFSRLCAHLVSTQADVVVGPVITVFDEHTPLWVTRYGFLSRDFPDHGAPMKSAPTNNTSLKLSSWRKVGRPEFDHAFSATGGSDTDFFTRVAALGLRIEASTEPVVYEDAPTQRLTLAWVTRRGIRTGMVWARIRLRQESRLRLFAGGTLRIAKGLALTAVNLVFRPKLVAKSYAIFARGLGFVSISLNSAPIIEYSR